MDSKGLISKTGSFAKGKPIPVQEYVFDEDESKKLDELVSLVADPETARKFRSDSLRAAALDIPVEKVTYWQDTAEFLRRLAKRLQSVAMIGVGRALAGQIEIAENPHLGPDSTKAFSEVAKIAKLHVEDKSGEEKDKGEGGGNTIINVEQLLIQTAQERLEKK